LKQNQKEIRTLLLYWNLVTNNCWVKFCSKIRSFRKPEPYKGKGIKFVGEEIRRKSGKSAGAK